MIENPVHIREQDLVIVLSMLLGGLDLGVLRVGDVHPVMNSAGVFDIDPKKDRGIHP